MNCAESKELLLEYYWEELSTDKKTGVASHLLSCAGCAKEYSEISKALTAAAKMKRPSLDGVSREAYVAQVMGKLKEKRPARVPAYFRYSALAGLAALVLAGFFIFGHRDTVQVKDIDAVYLLSESPAVTGADTAELEIELLADPEIADEVTLEAGS